MTDTSEPGPAPGAQASPGPAPGGDWTTPQPGPAPGSQASPGPAPGPWGAAGDQPERADPATLGAENAPVKVFVRAECSACGWKGTKWLSFQRNLAEIDKNNHLDDHPACVGKVGIEELD